MSVRADPQTLADMEKGLRVLQKDAESATDHALTAANRAQAKTSFAVARRKEELNAATAALAACLSREGADCSGFRARVALCGDRLNDALHAQRIVEDAIEAYRPRRLRFVDVSQQVSKDGQRFLQALREHLAQIGSVTGGLPATDPGSGYSTTAVSGAPAQRSPRDVPIAAKGLPNGFFLVPVSMIDMSTCLVSGPGQFRKGYSIKDLTWAFDAFDEVVLPGLAAGQTRADFQALDRAAGRYGCASFDDTYAGFADPNSSDVLKLRMQPNGTFAIEQGNHRIWLAAQLGRHAVPAKVVGWTP